MKASQVLRQYAEGRRDFRGVNLRGQSFKKANLSGADFSEADLHGANFTNAKLIDTRFRGAKAGLQRRWAIGLLIFLSILPLGTGFVATITGLSVAKAFIDEDISTLALFPGLIVLVVLVVFFLAVLRKNFAANPEDVATAWVGTVSVTLSAFGAVTAAVSAVGVVVAALAGALETVSSQVLAVSVAGGLSGALISAFSVGAALSVAGAVCVAESWAGVASVVWAITGAVAGAVSVDRSIVGFVAVLVAATAAVQGGYTGWLAVTGDEKWGLTRLAGIALASTGGTSFHKADLTNANFARATLKSTNFQDAILVRTCWHHTKKLDRVRPGTAYLRNSTVRELVRTGQGQDKNFERLDLRGVNLQGANLQDASFIGADLGEANLQDADLSRAKLVQTQLDRANLTGATLTGACIEDWGITPETKLNGVRCDYVFMRLPTKENPNPHRKPDDWNKSFAEGEFADFIAPMVDTLDLYHNRVGDPRLIAYAFNQLREKHPEDEIELVSIEKKGKNREGVLLKAETAPNADRSELHATYFSTYDNLTTLPPAALSELLAQKDARIDQLAGMVRMALGRPGIYAENYHHQGDIMPDKRSETSINQSGTFGVGVNQGEIKADKLAGTIHEAQSQNLAEAATEIQQLLKVLDRSYPADLPADTQAEIDVAVKGITKDPALKQRVVAALKEGGMKALEKFTDSPYVSILVAAYKGWQKGQ